MSNRKFYIYLFIYLFICFLGGEAAYREVALEWTELKAERGGQEGSDQFTSWWHSRLPVASGDFKWNLH
jgi:uncharacterized membrane protein YjdF